MAVSQTYNSFEVKSGIKGTYQVHFIGDLKKHLTITVTEKTVIIIDEKIEALFGKELESILSTTRYVAVQCDEMHKTIDYSQDVMRKLVAKNVRKDDTLLAIGGGITQDLTAFISSILFRGVDWKFYPTTLLAQCDSCIGSKSSINLDKFKNLVGTFNPPSEIFIYTPFLQTLSASEIKSGIGEMLHYFFTDGISLAQQISDQYERLLEDRDALLYFIQQSLQIKKKTIEIDEFDTSIRHIFNYGHTFGHAIEAITNFAIPHGQAVSIGMDLANYISLKKGMMTDAQFNEMHTILIKNIPPFRLTAANLPEYCEALGRDKKNKGSLLGCILSRGAGKVEKVFLEMDEPFKQLLLEYSSTYGK